MPCRESKGHLPDQWRNQRGPLTHLHLLTQAHFQHVSKHCEATAKTRFILLLSLEIFNNSWGKDLFEDGEFEMEGGILDGKMGRRTNW